jgi:hypothetical protein
MTNPEDMADALAAALLRTLCGPRKAHRAVTRPYVVADEFCRNASNAAPSTGG